jgi:metacaspase-1
MRTSLVVGIDKYPSQPLFGCVNDAADVTQMLTDIGGFTNPAVIPENEAQARNIKRQLHEKIVSLEPKDELVFFFAGHGTPFPEGNTGVNHQAICGIDFNNTFDTIITDADIALMLQDLRPDARLTMIVDACVSGGLQGDIDHLFDQFFDLALSTAFRQRTLALSPDLQAVVTRNDALGQSQSFAGVVAPHNVVLLAACEAKQPAGEADFGGRVNGVLTFFLKQRLSLRVSVREPANVTHVAVREAIHAHGFMQTAALHGRTICFGEPLID